MYAYDDLGRLTNEAEENGAAKAYTYDDYNNRSTMIATGLGQENYAVSYTLYIRPE